MSSKLRKLIFLKFFSSKTKLILVLVFLFILTSLFSRNYLQPAKADVLNYTEDFTTTTYEDSSVTTGKWDTSAGEAILWGREWRALADTSQKYERIALTSGHSVLPDMALDGNNNPYIVWYDNTSGNYEIYFSRFDPQLGWSDMDGNPGYVNISNTATSSRTCRILINSNNEPIVIWTEDLGGGGGAIYLVKWTTGVGWTDMAGNLWQHDIFANGYVDAYSQSFQLDSSGYPNLAWVDTSNNLYFSHWDGSQWAKMDGTAGQDLIDHSPSLILKVNLSLNSGNQPYLNWFSIVDEIFFIRWTPGSGLCGNPVGCWTNMAADTVGRENVSNTGGAVTTGSYMAIDSADNPYFIWADYSLDLFFHSQLLFKKWFSGVGWRGMDGISNFDNISNMPGADIGDSYRLKLDQNNIPYAVFIDNNTGNEDVYVSRWFPGTGWHSMDGLALWDNISANAGISDWPQIQFDSANNPHAVWRDDSAGNAEVLYRRWTPGVGWTQIDKATVNYNNISNNAGTSGFGLNNNFIFDDNDNFYLVWHDNTGGNNDIIFSQGLPNYQASETVQSLNVNTFGDYVTSATLTANQTLNGQSITYYLSNDGGIIWNQVISGSLYTFSNLGTDLRWKAVLSTTDTNVTPVINNLTITYSTKRITCSLSPINVSVGGAVNINASITFTPSAVWATIENGGNLINTVTLNDQGGGNYSNSVNTASNYLGQNNVAIFATDSGTGQTVTCNPSTGAHWQKLTVNDIPWEKRAGQRTVSYHGKMYMMGGITDDFASDVWSSSDGVNWKQETANASWAKRGTFGLVVFNDKMWLFGGNMYLYANDTSTYYYYKDIWSSTDGKNWTLENNNAPWGNRAFFATAVFDDGSGPKLWLSGGVQQNGTTFTNMNDVWSSVDGKNWVKVCDPLDAGNVCFGKAGGTDIWDIRNGHKMLNYGNKLWVMGGINLGIADSDVWSSSNGIDWTLETSSAAWGHPNPGNPLELGRNYFEAFVYNDGSGSKMWFLGGRSTDGTNEINYNDVYNSSDGITWTKIFDPGFKHQALDSAASSWTYWTARRTFAALVHNNQIWVIGGWEYGLGGKNDVWHSANGVNWTLVNQNYDGDFGPRWGSSIIAFKAIGDTAEKLWILGGRVKGNGNIDGQNTNDIWSSPDGRNWTLRLADTATPGVNQWSERSALKSVVFNNKLWAIGGCTNGAGDCLGYCVGGANDGQPCTSGVDCGGGGSICQSANLAEAWSTSDGISWDKAATPDWAGRYNPTVTVFDNGSGPKIWLTGGHTRGKCNGGTYAGSICYDNSNNQCAGGGSCSKICVGGTNKGNICSSNANCGGHLCAGPTTTGFLNDVWFSSDGNIWYSGFCNGGANAGAGCNQNADCASNVCQLLIANWSGRYNHTAVAFNDGSGEKLYVMGGVKTALGPPPAVYLNDVWSTADGITWTQESIGTLPARATAVTFNYNDKIWFTGGNQLPWFLPSLWTNDVWSSPDGANWTEITPAAEFRGRDYFSSTVFQNRMVLFGGDSNGGTTNDVWASQYNYLTFNVTSSAAPPSGNTDVAPNVPINFSCTAQNTNAISWTFEDTANNETGFRLYGPPGLILSTEPSIVTNLDHLNETNLETNTLYNDRYVKSFNSFGESAGSNTASCYTLANTPLMPIIGEVTENSIILKINANDANPSQTEYAIYDVNSQQYVQADGSFGPDPAWQTRAAWGGESGIVVTGETGEVTAQGDFSISLTPGQEYSFAVKARNGDGIETEFSASVSAQAEAVAPQISLTKGVGINISQLQLLNTGLAKIALAQTEDIGQPAWLRLLQELSIFLNIILIILIILLIVSIAGAIKNLGLKGKRIKLIGQLLFKKPAKVFAEHAGQDNGGTYKASYEKHKRLHEYSQKTLQRAIGLLALKVVILIILILTLSSLGHTGQAQNPPYDQDGIEVKTGDQLSYILEYNNQGNGPATNAVISDNMDDDLSYITGSAKIYKNNQEITTGFSQNGNLLSFNLGDINANEGGYVTFKVAVKIGTETKTITNQGQISGDNFTAVLSNTTNNAVAAAVIVPVCGNGTIEQGETCERNADCAADESCVNCQCQSNILPVPPVCGNGTIEQGETCESSSDCAADENCVSCQCQSNVLLVSPVCGNGTIEQGETCENNADCTADESCVSCQCQSNVPLVSPVCGNGTIEQGETCENNADCAADQTCFSCQCQGITPPIPPTPPGGRILGTIMQWLGENETIKFLLDKFFDNPQVEQTSQNIVTPALIVLAFINTIPTAIAITFNILPYLYLVFSEPFLWFFRRKRKKWGIVYDALTKLPVGLAVVRLFNKATNQLIQTKVTDKEGRYLMIVKEPGEYYITVTKPGYVYPTKYLKDDKEDAKYLDLYHGEPVKVTAKGAVITANIPLDPVAKKLVAEKAAVQHYVISNLRLIIAYVGLSLSILVLIIYPTAITIAAVIFHVILFLIFRSLIVPPKPKSWGIVYDEKTKEPLIHAIVRIFDTKFNKLLETQVTDGKGRYAFLVGKNIYQLLTEKAGYQSKQIKPVDLVQKEQIVNLDVGLKKT